MDHGLHFTNVSSSSIRKFVLASVLAVFTMVGLVYASQAQAAVTFAPAATVNTGANSIAVQTADVNGDNKLDIINFREDGPSISVHLGNGDGTFGSGISSINNGFSYAGAVGDYNGDGKADLVLGYYSAGFWQLFLGNNDGTFTGGVSGTVGDAPRGPQAADMNGDGKLDLVFASVTQNKVFVYPGNGNGTFAAAVTFNVGAAPGDVALKDLNGDGKLDVVSANRNANTVSVLFGTGTNTYFAGPAVNYFAGSQPGQVQLADLNGDNRPDIIVQNNGSVAVLLQNPGGTFASPTTVPGSGGVFFVANDFDGDGKVDIANSDPGGVVRVYLGTGTGTFGPANVFAAPASWGLATGDFNGDGRPDLVSAGIHSGQLQILLNTSDNTPPDTIIDTATPASPANTGVRTFTFHGVDPAPATPPITFECRIDGGAWFACSSGYSTPNLADGTHTVDIRAKDAAGNVDASPDSSTWVVDKTAPNTFIDSATPASPTNNQVRNFTFHGVDPAPGTAITLECQVDSGPWFSCNSGTYNTGTLPEGNHTFRVRAIDAANNVDPSPATSTWMIDITKPDITITTPGVRERFVMGSGSKNYSCNDPLHGGPPPVASGVDTCTDNGFSTAHLGNFRFQVDAKDFAGNTSTDAHAYAVDPPRYADLINPDHPIVYYRLGDPLGSDSMADSSGNNRNGEYKNGIALRRPPAPACHVRPHAPYTCDLTADPQDWSAFFPARDGYGFTNNITAPTEAYTIEGWIKRADNNDGSIMGHGGGGQLFVHDGKLALRQTQDTVYAGGPTLTPGQWFHVAGTWDGTETKLYVNGNLVGSSNSANKAPSGTATLYVGYGDQAPWFHGNLDEMAYYGSALPGSAFATRYEVGTAHDVPSPVGGPPIQRPEAIITAPNNNGLYAKTKMPPVDFSCEDLDGNATVASCTATVDGNPVLNGAALPDTPGSHPVVVTAVDTDGLTRSHTHTYTIKTFGDIYNTDAPIAYYRLGDLTGDPMKDSSGQGRDGTYKNDQESGPIGISGDFDHARNFYGAGGYGFVSSIPAPKYQSTIEVWVNPADQRKQSIVGHGDAGEIFIGEDGVLSFRHMGTTVTTSALPLNVFTQVVGVWDGTTISLYVNGVLKASTEATKRPSSSSTFYVGFGEIQPWFRGSLDEVAYYDKALTPNRILEHFLADPPPPNETPVVSDDPVTSPDRPVTTVPGDKTPSDPGTKPGTGDQPSGGTDIAAETGGVTKAVKKGTMTAISPKCKKFKKNPVKLKRCQKKSRKH